MRYVIVRAGVAGFLVGTRFVTRADGPFAVDDDRRAEAMIKAGLAEGCAPLPTVGNEDVMNALFPAAANAEKAVAPHRRGTAKR